MSYEEHNSFLIRYKKLGYFLLNSVVFFVVLNGLLAILYWGYDSLLPKTDIEKKYGMARLSAVYPGRSGKEIRELLRETWARPVVYEPFTQFREKEFEGRFINVSAHGFRFSQNQGPWPPVTTDFKVFLFGGSTSFGYGVSDDETVASRLQAILPLVMGDDKKVRVYNWGRGFYYSTQERILFEQLLGAGFVPDMVIFIDGLNEFYRRDNEPVFTGQLKRLMHNPRVQQMVLDRLPVTRFVRDIKQGVRQMFPSAQHQQHEAATTKDAEVAGKVLANYKFNKKIIELIASSYGIPAFFVWQPTPSYQYDRRYHLFYEEDEWLRQLAIGYKMMEQRVGGMGENFVWAAGIQQGIKAPLYVDRVHYTAAMNEKLAQFIVTRIRERIDSH